MQRQWTPKQLRIRAWLDQRQLAERANVSQRAVSKLELDGARHSVDALNRIARALVARYEELGKSFDIDDYFEAAFRLGEQP